MPYMSTLISVFIDLLYLYKKKLDKKTNIKYSFLK